MILLIFALDPWCRYLIRPNALLRPLRAKPAIPVRRAGVRRVLPKDEAAILLCYEDINDIRALPSSLFWSVSGQNERKFILGVFGPNYPGN